MRMVDYFVRHASYEQRSEIGQAAGSHDDHISVEFFRSCNDGGGNLASGRVPGFTGYFEASLPKFRHNLVNQVHRVIRFFRGMLSPGNLNFADVQD